MITICAQVIGQAITSGTINSPGYKDLFFLDLHFQIHSFASLIII